ncbi:MAG: FxsA family protein [Rhodobacterales bacterium]|nr:FxsA family protein [Rhodobacterales bacterium]
MIEMQDVQSPLAHRLLVTIGGGLLVLPGFLTDAVGLALLVPPLRRIALRLVAWRLGNPESNVSAATTIDGEWREVHTSASKMSDSLPPDSTRH